MSSLTQTIHPLIFQHRQVGTAVYEIVDGQERLVSYEITDPQAAELIAHYLIPQPRQAVG